MNKGEDRDSDIEEGRSDVLSQSSYNSK